MNRPEVVSDPAEAYRRVRSMQQAGRSVGLTPTMGALHEGHLSLVRAAGERCDASVVTIFVNPTQFGPAEDFDQYPRTLREDCELLAPLNVDFVFAPHVDVMYPAGMSTSVQPPSVAEPLEGVCRPGHFAGVCTIVLKLLQLLPADSAFFGQKDFQQALVIQTMVADLNVPTEIRVEPIVREPDGLAMSSRNRYLSADERERALSLSRCLSLAEQAITEHDADSQRVLEIMEQELRQSQVSEIEYVAVADPKTLSEFSGPIDRDAVALVAARVGMTRLIDNRLIRISAQQA